MIQTIRAAPKNGSDRLMIQVKMAEPTGFEPATSDVTGRRSNQLNYDSALKVKSKKAKGKSEKVKKVVRLTFPFFTFNFFLFPRPVVSAQQADSAEQRKRV